MFDNLTREQFTGAEKRSALEIAVIRDSLRSMDGEIRWVPHEKNSVDCLTKVKGNVLPLLELMKKSRYKLVGEEQEMAQRAEFRAATGKRNPRPKVTGDGSRASVPQPRASVPQPKENRTPNKSRGANSTQLLSMFNGLSFEAPPKSPAARQDYLQRNSAELRRIWKNAVRINVFGKQQTYYSSPIRSGDQVCDQVLALPAINKYSCLLYTSPSPRD